MTKSRLERTVRSEKQREHVARVKQQYSEATRIVLPPKGSGEPSTSWWLGADRDAFSARAEEERRRMLNSRFAQVSDPTYRG